MTQTERDYPYGLTGPEIELIEVVRLAHDPDFRLTVSHRGATLASDGFAVRVENIATGKFLAARGQTFEDAWRNLGGLDLHGKDLDLMERIAARGFQVVDGGTP